MATLGPLASDLDEQLHEFCADVFEGLPRVDQRRAGETYLRGLLNCPGRKSVRRMAATLPSRHSEQSLQQFINQSTWDYEPIRQRLMRRLGDSLRPTAWVIEEVSFPKHGRLSAAVERQYVRSLQKVCNCQLAVTATLTTDRFSVPVNWRLVMPESWGSDHERRLRARVPHDERPRPYWQYQIEVLDDMALDWGMLPAPVMVDARQLPTAEALLTALEERHLPYLVQVSENLRVRYDSPAKAAAGATTAARASSWHGAVGELTRRAAAVSRTTVGWRDVDEELVRRSQFLRVPVQPPVTAGQDPRPGRPGQPRWLVVEWPLSKPHPRGYWLTNIDNRPLDELVELAKLRQRVGPRIEVIADQYGLRDYEGRTFAGWHHHVTLAAAAYVFQVLSALPT
jgi:hypothetical protein